MRGGANKRINTKSPFFNKKSGDKIFTEKKSIHFVKQLRQINNDLLNNYMGTANTLLRGMALQAYNKQALGVNFGKFYLE